MVVALVAFEYVLGQLAQGGIFAAGNFHGSQALGSGMVHGHEAGKVLVETAVTVHGVELLG